MTSKVITSEVWLDLADAARYLGIHFTTLRRWADAGNVACIRTPGGHRRFAFSELQRFLAQSRQLPTLDTSTMQITTLTLARQHIQRLDIRQQAWFTRLSDEQRQRFRIHGQRLVGLLMQYSARSDDGQTFIEEGKRMAAEYGIVCHDAGLSASETIKVFLFFRRSIMDSIHETAGLAGPYDRDAQRLYQRMSDFLDIMLLATLEGYNSAHDGASPPSENRLTTSSETLGARE